MTFVVASFYKYVGIEDPLKLRNEQLELCQSLNLKGRILIGNEGINGSVCGKKHAVGEYKAKMAEGSLFSGMEFKEQGAQKQAFSRLYISVRKEIVHFGAKVDLRNTAQFLEPKQLKEWLDNNEDLVLVDMRNDYESKIGKFRNAVTLSIGNFRDLPSAVDGIKSLKDKKIVAYCTGGIRCEKASAFLKESGFSNVYQLKGGILKFGEQFPDTYWEGRCFVFDERIAIGLNKSKNDPIAVCGLCSKKAENYINCHNLDCDKLFSCCDDCLFKYNASCSDDCSTAPKRRKRNIVVDQSSSSKLLSLVTT
ncbi:rhodanese-related sulfurtransferase [Candidatus Woesearchaeota archaeon]|nr:rhodanese-related sulfurtransferase [Candidatus Woesearchaeota archaeon]